MHVNRDVSRNEHFRRHFGKTSLAKLPRSAIPEPLKERQLLGTALPTHYTTTTHLFVCQFETPSECASAMISRQTEVVADPWKTPQSRQCMACGQFSKKQPTIFVSLANRQVAARLAVNTGDIENPFREKCAGSFLLCTACKSSKTGWSGISDPRIYGARARSALKA